MEIYKHIIRIKLMIHANLIDFQNLKFKHIYQMDMKINKYKIEII